MENLLLLLFLLESIDYVTSVKRINGNSIVATDYELSQNYPNPFNPTTKIRFSLPENVKVKLNVYNMLGQKVATLVNASKQAGAYEVNWNAPKLSSGIYIYRLEAGQNIISKKMTLLK